MLRHLLAGIFKAHMLTTKHSNRAFEKKKIGVCRITFTLDILTNHLLRVHILSFKQFERREKCKNA